VRRGQPVGAASLAVAAAAIAASWTFMGGGTSAIVVVLCLGVGVVIWSTVILPASDASAVPLAPLPAPA
jgi:hypothetical protein